MKFLLSIYNIHQLSEPYFIMQTLKKFDSFSLLDGFEIKADLDHPMECVRLSEYATHLKGLNLKLQIHAHDQIMNHYDDYKKLTEYLTFYQKLSDIMKETIKITIHPVHHPIGEHSYYRTLKLISKLNAIVHIYQYDLTFAIENVNSQNFELSTLLHQNLINYCWDIGHEVAMNQCEYVLEDTYEKHVTNVHIHDVNKSDHHPLIYGNTDYLKSLAYLINIGYKGSIVIEVQYPFLKGDNWYQKFEDYLEQICILKNITNMLSTEVI
ncbi:MAG: sugar phosphate isomerase/epimerase [Clostridia bacterium]|nr:sugar phosphate isomerase/epimerase [Clostridia bacterium]